MMEKTNRQEYTMKQIIGLWGKSYQEIGELIGRNKDSVGNRMSNSRLWSFYEVKLIVEQVRKDTGLDITVDDIRL